MESEEKVVEEIVAEKPKTAPRKKRSNKSAAQRKTEKAKINAEKAATVATKATQAAKPETAADEAALSAETAERQAEPVAEAAEMTAAKKPAAKTTTKSTRARKPTAKKTTKETTPSAAMPAEPVTEKQAKTPAELKENQTPAAATPEKAAAAEKKTDVSEAAQGTPPKEKQDKPVGTVQQEPVKEPEQKPEEKTEEKAEPETEDAEEPEETEEEKRRAAEITRTVQVSIEQILARAAEQQEKEKAAAAPEPDEIEDDNDEAEPIAQRIGEVATDSLRGLLKWALLVLVFVLLIAVLGVYWLYRSATPEMLPRLTLTMDGQVIEETEYLWHVPVVSNMFKRDYAETISTTPVELTEAIESNEPELVLTQSEDYETALKITDSDNQEIFNGTLAEFKGYTFVDNGTYTGKLVVTAPESRFAGSTLVTGEQTYQFVFSVDIRPTVRINTQSITQGGVVSVHVTGIPKDETPTLRTTLNNAGFVKAANGWIAYIPVPCEADTGEPYTITVMTNSYEQDLSLTVRPRTSAYKDYTYAGAMTSPYIGVEDTPDAVRSVLDICDPQVYWTASGFVQPFIRSITVTLPFGTTEYVGRTATQRAKNTGEGRTSTCVVVTGRQGEDLISPADGRVVLAEDLGGTAGNTVVVEHGAGLKSVFYNLYSIDVEEGNSIRQGQSLGKTKKVTVGEVRIGQVPVEPLSIWRGQCDAVKTF